jgi:hypothetical protein
VDHPRAEPLNIWCVLPDDMKPIKAWSGTSRCPFECVDFNVALQRCPDFVGLRRAGVDACGSILSVIRERDVENQTASPCLLRRNVQTMACTAGAATTSIISSSKSPSASKIFVNHHLRKLLRRKHRAILPSDLHVSRPKGLQPLWHFSIHIENTSDDVLPLPIRFIQILKLRRHVHKGGSILLRQLIYGPQNIVFKKSKKGFPHISRISVHDQI